MTRPFLHLAGARDFPGGARPEAAAGCDPAAYREVMGHCPSVVAVVGTMNEGGPVGCVATSFLSLSVSPPALVVSLASSSRTLADVRAAGSFTLSVLAQDQHELVRIFSVDERTRRFDRVAYTVAGCGPLLTDAVAGLACVVSHTVPALDHTLVVGKVVTAERAHVDPLLLRHGRPHGAYVR